MKEGRSLSHSRHGPEPGLQVICLASGGGPSEDDVTGFLMRSVSTNWSKNSVLAVDAGTHMAAITRILESDFPRVSTGGTWPVNGGVSIKRPDTPSDYSCSTSASSREATPEAHVTRLKSGPFSGLPFPYSSARANSLHFVRECVSTYLITHPHLDHISALAINTAAFHNTSRPKRLAALPSTVTAIKTHIFNDVIWPNLTDEDGGVGFLTFQRLTQGGNIAVGEGSGKGYIEVCDGLCVKGMKISHGHCTRGLMTLPQRASDVGLSEVALPKSAPATSSTFAGSAPAPPGAQASAREPSPSQWKARRTPSITQFGPFNTSAPGTPGLPPAMTMSTTGAAPAAPGDPSFREVVVDSTAYFVRDDLTKREVLMFGDVEPDSLSLSPRTLAVWQEAAPKVANGALKAIIIECSFDDSQADSILFGHLAPRHLVRELAVLAELVKQRRYEHKERRESRKRKRHDGVDVSRRGSGDAAAAAADGTVSPTATADTSFDSTPHKRNKRKASLAGPAFEAAVLKELPRDRREQMVAERKGSIGSRLEEISQTSAAGAEEPPLAGLKVLIMHMKDSMRDGPVVGDTIVTQLNEHEARVKEADGVGLGCEFVICRAGGSYFL